MKARSFNYEKKLKPKKNEAEKEKIKRLEEENLCLKAELEYSKKMRAVVQVLLILF